MDVILFIIGLLLTGLIVGALGRLLLPGRDPMSIMQTIALGIAASLVAGLIAYYVFDKDEGPGFLFSVLCAIALVYAVRKIRERDASRPRL
ncbi:MAG: GlsB/YeaQ/YmgE family stress response membrane protein [Actinobacteria bacterium]|nr:MAG: GlsB/YeaQ/YmgE family stress response membrane protein [Actinomycetota bacterium]